MIQFGEEYLLDDVSYDYFAVSLPDTMIYEDDIVLRNRLYCHYLIALGSIGLNKHEDAKTSLGYVLNHTPNHQGAICHSVFLKG